MGVKATFYLRVYNVEPELLRKAIESVLNQTEPDFRFIIQDNGSTDGSNEIIKEYAGKDSRIEMFRNEVNSKVTEEELRIQEEVLYRNVEGCNAQYFAIIDSDDYYEKDFLEKAYREAEHKNADIVFAGYRQEEANGENVVYKVPKESYFCDGTLSEEQFFQGYSLFRTLWGNLYSARLWRRYWEILGEEHPEYMINGLDTYVNLQLLKEIERFVLLEDCLYVQYIRKNSVYKSDIRVERLKETDSLFLQGIEVAQKYQILNAETISFLASVYYYHAEDVIYGIVKSEKKELVQRAAQILESSEVYGMLAEKGKDFQNLLRILQLKGEQLCRKDHC